jgi:ubiquinone biosynthesis protein
MKERIGINGLFKRVSKNAPQWLEQLPEIPDLVMNAMFELRAMGQSNKEQTQLLKSLNTQISKQRSSGRLGALALVAALIGSTLPLMGLASQSEALVGASVLGSFGLYWMFLKS